MDLEAGEPLSPLSQVPAAEVGAHVLELDAWSSGVWLVETVSGARHVLDLDDGIHLRVPTASGSPRDGTWRLIDEIGPWPRVNDTFGLVVVRMIEDDESLTDEDVAAMTSSFVTRIVRMDRDSGLPRLPELPDATLIAQAPPRNAWLLMSDDDSHIDLATGESDWTSPKHAQRGDLALIYWQSPRKQVAHVGRFSTPPVFEHNPEAERRFRNAWWADLWPQGDRSRLVPAAA